MTPELGVQTVILNDTPSHSQPESQNEGGHDAIVQSPAFPLAVSWFLPSLKSYIKAGIPYDKALRGLLTTYGDDRPTAVVDLGSNTWAFSSYESTYCRSCKFVRASKAGMRSCSESDRSAAYRTYQSGGCGIFQCACLGLIDLAIPIKAMLPNRDPARSDGHPVAQVVGVLLTGQYRHVWLRRRTHEEVMEVIADDNVPVASRQKMASDICDAIPSVRLLESDISSIAYRLLTVNAWLQEYTHVRDSQVSSCFIESSDIAAISNLCRDETVWRSSLSELATRGTRPQIEACDLEWLGGAWHGEPKEKDRSMVCMWNWSTERSSQSSSTLALDRWLRWSLPIDPLGELTDIPFAHARNILRDLRKAFSDGAFTKTPNWTGMTVRDLMVVQNMRSPPLYLGIAARDLREFPGTNPGIEILLQGQWKASPSRLVLDSCATWAAGTLDAFAARTPRELPRVWLNLLSVVDSVFDPTNRGGLNNCCDRQEVQEFLKDTSVDEYSRAGVGLLLGSLRHADAAIAGGSAEAARVSFKDSLIWLWRAGRSSNAAPEVVDVFFSHTIADVLKPLGVVDIFSKARPD